MKNQNNAVLDKNIQMVIASRKGEKKEFKKIAIHSAIAAVGLGLVNMRFLSIAWTCLFASTISMYTISQLMDSVKFLVIKNKLNKIAEKNGVKFELIFGKDSIQDVCRFVMPTGEELSEEMVMLLDEELKESFNTTMDDVTCSRLDYAFLELGGLEGIKELMMKERVSEIERGDDKRNLSDSLIRELADRLNFVATISEEAYDQELNEFFAEYEFTEEDYKCLTEILAIKEEEENKAIRGR